MPRVTQEKLPARLTVLKNKHGDRVARQTAILLMGRGIDPRTAMIQNMSWNLNHNESDPDAPLHTNDPRTYLDIGIHLLSGRPLEWHMPRYSDIPDDVEEEHGKAERTVQSFFGINNKRLRNKQRPRLERQMADSACRMGMVVLYKEKVTFKGKTAFVIEPWDPTTVYERSDDEGLAEIGRDYVGSLYDLKIIAKREEEGWDLDKIEALIEDDQDEVSLTEYYLREGEKVWHAVMRTDGGKDVFLSLTLMKDKTEITVVIAAFNGEAFPGEHYYRAVQSILEPNFDAYLFHNDNIKRIEAHRDKVLAAKYVEKTSAARPGSATASDLASSDEVKIFSYRVNEDLTLVQQPQFDPSLAILGTEYPGQIQRGGVPYIFTGAIETNLSGFAIFQLLNAAMSAVSEGKIVLQEMYSDLGQWMLEELKADDTKSGSIEILSKGAANRDSHMIEDISFNDLPRITAIQNKINLAQPSDLIERMNIAKIANPGGGQMLTLNTIFNELLPDIVPDAQGEANALKDERIMQLPIMMMLDARRQLIEMKAEWVAAGRIQGAAGIQSQIDLIDQSIAGQSQGLNAQTNVGTESQDPNADPRVNPNNGNGAQG